MPDYSQEYVENPANVKEELHSLVRDLEQAEREVNQRKIELARAETRERDLREILIPELMQSMGIKKIETSDGINVSVEDDVYAKISHDNSPEAFKWLDDNGHGGMVKRKVTVEFNRDQEDTVKELVTKLRIDFPQTREEKKVESQTLKAWVRRRRKEGKPVPEELFGVHVRPVAKISRSKV